MENQRIDAAFYAERISNCCRMLCCPKLPPTPTGEPPPQLVLCANLLSYLCETALLHKFKEDTSFFGRQKAFEVLTSIAESFNKETPAERKAFSDALNKAKNFGKTDQGKLRIFTRVLINQGFYVPFIQNMNMSCELLEKHYEADAFIRNFEAVEEVSVSIDTLTSHIKLSISINDPDINSKEYWEHRQDSVNFNPDNVYAKRTVLALIADDNPQLLEIQGIFAMHIRRTKFETIKRAATLAEALAVKKVDIPLMIPHSAIAGALIKCVITPQIRKLALASSESRSMMLENFYTPRFHGKYHVTPNTQSLIRTNRTLTEYSALVQSTVEIQSLMRASIAIKLPISSKEAQGLIECSLAHRKHTDLSMNSKRTSAILSAKNVLLISTLLPEVDASQSLIKSTLYYNRLKSLTNTGAIPGQAGLRCVNARSKYNKVRNTCISTQADLRRNKQCFVVDFTKLFISCREAQSLIRSRKIHETFQEKVDSCEVLQASVKGGTGCVKFLLNMIASEWTEGMLKTQITRKHRFKLEESTRATQVLFVASIQRNFVYKKDLASVIYVQNVLIDRRNEKAHAEEIERLVETKMKEAATQGESLIAALDDYEVDLSGKNSLSRKRPVWVPDANSKTCYMCNKAFSFGNRRHHCRNCGNLVCTQCTIFMPLPHLEYHKPVRVCKSCKAIILASK